jgi:hypothetical protein
MRTDDPFAPALAPDEEERDYLRRRADYHRDLAARTQRADARLIHLQLVQLYEEQITRLDIVHPDQQPAQKD